MASKNDNGSDDITLAILSCFFGVVSAFRLFAMVKEGLVPERIRPYTSMMLASVGLVLGIIAWMRVKRSQGIKSGWYLAVSGILLSVAVLIVALFFMVTAK